LIESLEITGYRGIGRFSLTPSRINVFIGRNNTGKSSVLEAAALAASSSTGYLDALGINILERLIERRGWNLRYFVRDGYEAARVDSIISSRQSELLLQYSEGLPSVLEDKVTPVLLQWVERMSARRRPTGVVFRTAEGDLGEALNSFTRSPKLVVYLPDGRLDVATTEGKILLSLNSRVPSRVLFSGIAMRASFRNLYDSLLPTARFALLMERLREMVPYLSDIRTLGEEVYVYLRDPSSPIPASSMGDGFIDALRLAFMSAIIEDGLLVLEEPENNLHPGLMEPVVKQLVTSTRRLNVQLFISTHSLEFLNHLLTVAGEEVSIVRMYRADGEIDYEVMSSTEALQESREIGLDLRGV